MSTRVPAPELQPLAESMLDRYLAAGNDSPVVLFVLGAAASFRSGMPAWDHVKEPLIRAAAGCFHNSQHFVDEAWRQLAPYLGPAPRRYREEILKEVAKTEQILGVACVSEVVREEVVKVLTETFRKNRHDRTGEAPQLAYELIAHFLRHGFVDHVVNFNFDEALDVALDNELGSGGYRRILSDSDVVLEAGGDGPRPRLPHHLKLHGTISVTSSLRFTKDHTQSIPVGMLNVLDRIAFEGGTRRLHLVTLGYSWNDPDFVNWVVARAELIDRVTIVRGKGTKLPALLRARYDERSASSRRALPDGQGAVELEQLVRTVAASRFEIDANIETSIDDVLWALANGIQERLAQLKVDYVPIARHVVLGHLFGPERQLHEGGRPVKWGFDPVNRHTAHLRLRLELWLQLFKCKGMMSLSGIAETPRIQRYMDGLARPYDVDGNLPRGTTHAAPDQVRETLFHPAHDQHEAFDSLIHHAILSLKVEEVAVPTFEVESGALRLDSVPGQDFLRGLFSEIWECDETEVTTAADPRVKWLFANPQPLPTYLELRRKTNELLGGGWDHLLVIAESGEWLAKWLQHHADALAPAADRWILLIRVGDDGLRGWGAWESIKRRNETLFAEAGPRLLQVALPWWRHNRHLTLALLLHGKRVKLHQGIYFRRRLKASRIAPVSLEHEGDCAELFLVFLVYAVRALRWEATAGSVDFGNVLSALARGLRGQLRAPNRDRLDELTSKLEDAARAAASGGPDRLI